jgi:hypothetical protein
MNMYRLYNFIAIYGYFVRDGYLLYVFSNNQIIFADCSDSTQRPTFPPLITKNSKFFRLQ